MLGNAVELATCGNPKLAGVILAASRPSWVEVVSSNVFARRTRQGYLRLIGQTVAGRYLTVFVAPRGGGEYGLATARDATLPERRQYQQHRRK